MEASELLSDAFEVLSSKEIKLLAMRAKPDKDQLVEEEDLALANVVMQEAQKKLISQVSVLLPKGACAPPAPSPGCLPRPRLALPSGLHAHLGGLSSTCARGSSGSREPGPASLWPGCAAGISGRIARLSFLLRVSLIVVPRGSVVEKGTFICQVTLKGARVWQARHRALLGQCVRGLGFEQQLWSSPGPGSGTEPALPPEP